MGLIRSQVNFVELLGLGHGISTQSLNPVLRNIFVIPAFGGADPVPPGCRYVLGTNPILSRQLLCLSKTSKDLNGWELHRS
jgi:hypothetical protein